jgi:hypothetical protein
MAFRHLKQEWDATEAAPITGRFSDRVDPRLLSPHFVTPRISPEVARHAHCYACEIDPSSVLNVMVTSRGARHVAKYQRDIALACHIIRAMRRLFRFTAPINITWYPTKLKKVLPREGEPIGADHVNSGYTEFVPHKCIVIYRREEMHKVLTHELIHHMGVDVAVFSREAALELDARIAREFNVDSRNGRIGSGEAVCDLLAIWLWSAWCVCSVGGNERKWAEVMSMQTRFAVNQALTIMEHKKYHLGAPQAAFVEHTHVFAYYILKSAMMCDPDLVQDIFRHALAGTPIPNMGGRMIRALKANRWSKMKQTSLPKNSLCMTLPFQK